MLSQALQLLVCDWLLTTRTEMWQRDCVAMATSTDEEAVTTTTVFADDLASFQQDLATLRRLAHHWRAAMTKVSFCLILRFCFLVMRHDSCVDFVTIIIVC